VSEDSGATWRRYDDPCGGTGRHEWDTVAVALDQPTIAALCARRLTQRHAIVVSHDLGADWTPRRGVPIRRPDAIGLDGPHTVISTGTVSRVGAVLYFVDTSGSDGTTWANALTARYFGRIPSVDEGSEIRCADNGCVVFVEPNQLFYTTDGGRSWGGNRLPD
jgi:photosystem II stability/assembly factor-like uncharacterized protein